MHCHGGYHASAMKTLRRVGLLLFMLQVVARSASAQVSPRSDDGIIEAVIRYITAKDPTPYCVLVEIEDGDAVYLNQPLVQRLQRRGINIGSDDTHDNCKPISTVLEIGPIEQRRSRRVQVLAGRVPVVPGRPAYVLNRTWLGRWKVTDVLPAE